MCTCLGLLLLLLLSPGWTMLQLWLLSLHTSVGSQRQQHQATGILQTPNEQIWTLSTV
jgi:hypothetical protein